MEQHWQGQVRWQILCLPGQLTVLRSELRHYHLQGTMNWTDIKNQFLSSCSSLEEQRNLLDIFKQRFLSRTVREKRGISPPSQESMVGDITFLWDLRICLVQLLSSITRISYLLFSHITASSRDTALCFFSAGYKTHLRSLTCNWAGLAACSVLYCHNDSVNANLKTAHV